MRLTRGLLGVVIVAVATRADAQQVDLNFDDLACHSNSLSTYAGWIGLTSGISCQDQNWGWWSASSAPNFIWGTTNVGWQFAGPVTFNGLYASGFGTWMMTLYSGGHSVYNQTFGLFSGAWHISSGYSGSVDQVQLTSLYGSTGIGVDDITFTPPSNPPGNNPPGNNPPNGPGQDCVDPNGCSSGGDVTGAGTGPTTVTPEPGSLVLMATGLVGLGAAWRRRRVRQHAA